MKEEASKLVENGAGSAPEELFEVEEAETECSSIWRCFACIVCGFAVTLIFLVNDKSVSYASEIYGPTSTPYAPTTPLSHNDSQYSGQSGGLAPTASEWEGGIAGGNSAGNVGGGLSAGNASEDGAEEDDEVEIKDDTEEDLEFAKDHGAIEEEEEDADVGEGGNESLVVQIEEVQSEVENEGAEEEEEAEEDFGEDYDVNPYQEKKWRDYKYTFNILAKYGRSSIKLGVLPIWQEFQKKMVRVLGRMLSPEVKRQPLRVLIAASVSGKPTSVQSLTSWANYFEKVLREQKRKHGFSDKIDFALNHYDYKFSPWESFMAHHNHSVVLIKAGLRCKTVFWKKLGTNISANYDYFWLIDDDLEVNFLNWEITRSLLKLLNPLIAHPGVMPVSRGARSSDHRSMRMHVFTESNSIALGVNAKMAEVMAPIISTAFWPLIHKRLETWQLKSVWCMDCFWSNAANKWGGHVCNILAPLVVFHSSPVVHMNYHSILQSKKMHLNTTKRHELGCIKHNIGHNKFLSKFSRDIVRPSSRTGKENMAAHDILEKVVKPRIACHATSGDNTFSVYTKWTVKKLRRLSQGHKI